MKVRCVFSLELPHGGDSNKYAQLINTKTENYLKLSQMSAAMFFFLFEAQKRLRNSRGK